MTLLSSIHRHPSGLHGQEEPYPVENEIPRHRLLYSQLQTNRPKGPLPSGITRNEPTIPGWSTKRHSRRRNAIPHPNHLSRTHREGPRQCLIKSAAPKCIRRKQKLRSLRSPTTTPSVEQ